MSVHHLVAVIILRHAVHLLGLRLGLHRQVALHDRLLLLYYEVLRLIRIVRLVVYVIVLHLIIYIHLRRAGGAHLSIE